MTTTLTPQLGLRVSSTLTADSRYNLFRIDELASRFALMDDSSTQVRSQTSITIEPNSVAVGGSGTGGTVQIGTPSHVLDALDVYGTASFSRPTRHLDQGTNGLGHLRLRYDSTLFGTQPVDVVDRTLTVYMAGADRVLALGGNVSIASSLTLTGSSLTLNMPVATTWTLPSSNGLNGYLLTTNGAGVLSWQAPVPLGVTSVGLAAPAAVFTVSGSPVTSSGTLTLGFQTQAANLVFAGPASGGAATPTFRALVLADIPPGVAPMVADTNSIDLTVSGLNVLTADLRIADSTLDTTVSGVRVAPLGITDAQVSNSAAILLTKTNLTGLTNKPIPLSVDEVLIYDTVAGFNKKATISSLASALAISYAATWTVGTSLVVTHNLGTLDVDVTVYDLNNGATVLLDSVARTSTNALLLIASEAPTGSGWRVVVLSAGSPALVATGVTSVGLAAPSIFTVSGSPVTSTGTLTFALATQAANLVLAGPASGGATAPTFRALVAADVPALPYQPTGNYITALTGDVAATGPGSVAATIQAGVVTNSKLSTMAATTIKGNATGGAASPTDLTGTQTTALLDTFTSGLKGLAPASGGGTANFLRADGTWAPTPNSGGTVTSVSVVTANGVSGSVATPTTTPAITLTLGAITPSSVAASGTVTGSNLSGTNTGDQTITLTGDVTGSGTGSFAATVASVGGSTAAAVGAAAVAVAAATSANTPSTLVLRDGSGNFAAGTITATLTGTATNVSGVVAIANGGTGQTTAGAARTALGAAASGANSDITSLSGLTTPLSVLQGGTGATTAAAARTALGAAASGANSDITSIAGLTTALSVAQGGTGLTTVSTNGVLYGNGVGSLGTATAGSDYQALRMPAGGGAPAFGAIDISQGAAVTGTLPLSRGGTGQTTAVAAFDALSPLTLKGDLLTNDNTNDVRLAVGTNGQVLSANSATSTGLQWITPNAGTVTSVALTVPSIMSVTGSPVTTSGTLAIALATQTANTVFAGPTSGGAATPTFRALVLADIPNTFDFGDGSDGAVTISVDTTLTRDMYYSSLTVNSAINLTTAGFKIFVSGTLSNAGTIRHNGTAGAAGSGITSGAGGAGAAAGTLGAGATGATTGAAAAAAGQAGGASATAMGESAGAGGAGGTGGAGGAAGVATYAPHRNTAPAIVYGITLITGGAGGGSGGNGSTSGGTRGNGGGGGGGGGIVYLRASTLTNTGTISALGGAGGAGAASVGTGGNGGGGGGGGGGVIYLLYRTVTLGTATVAGGAGGAAGANGGGTAGVAGSAGTTGRLIQFNVATQVWS